MKTRMLLTALLLVAVLLTSCSTPATPEPSVQEEMPAATELPAPTEASKPVEPSAPTAEPVKESVTLRFEYYEDGNESSIIQPILDRFMAENPDITVVLDVVPYTTIDQNLPAQVAAGEGPDLARITNLAGYQGQLLDLRPYLVDSAYYEANFPAPVLKAMEYGGFPDDFTVTGPFVNKTLFEQAGVQMGGEGTTWEEWTALTKQVAEATGTQYAIGMDRTGHRFAAMAMSMGATLLDDNGNFTVNTPGFANAMELLKNWHDNGLTQNDLWYNDSQPNNCIDAFKAAQMVMCMAGSWQISALAKDVGTAFDWVAVPNPAGAGGSTGVAGGSAVVIFSQTEHPEEAAKLAEFLIQPENYGEFNAGTLSLPAQTEVASNGVEFKTDNALVSDALSVFTAEVPKLKGQAVSMYINPFAFAYYRNSSTRIVQYMLGELTLDEALQNLQTDIDSAIEAAKATTTP